MSYPWRAAADAAERAARVEALEAESLFQSLLNGTAQTEADAALVSRLLNQEFKPKVSTDLERLLNGETIATDAALTATGAEEAAAMLAAAEVTTKVVTATAMEVASGFAIFGLTIADAVNTSNNAHQVAVANRLATVQTVILGTLVAAVVAVALGPLTWPQPYPQTDPLPRPWPDPDESMKRKSNAPRWRRIGRKRNG